MTLTLHARAAACPHMKWVSGMQDASDGSRLVRVLGNSKIWYCRPDRTTAVTTEDESTWMPDTDDHGTLGIIEHVTLPEAWGGPIRDAAVSITHVHIHDEDLDRLVPGVVVRVFAWADTWREVYCGEPVRSLAEGLVLALEAAP